MSQVHFEIIEIFAQAKSNQKPIYNCHLSAIAGPAEKQDCSKLDEALDDLGAAQGFSTLNDKYKLATTRADYDKRCEEMVQAVKTLRKYNKDCFSSLTQQVFSAILGSRAKMNELYCRPDSDESKKAIEANKCVSENAFSVTQEAEKKTILSSQVLLEKNIPDDKLRMRAACCGVLASKGYFIDATRTKCAKYESVYSDYVDSYTSEAMGLICPEADKLECEKLEPLKLEGVATKTKFFLGPMLKLVKSLDH